MQQNITPVVYAALGITLGVTEEKEILNQFNSIQAYIDILEDAKRQMRDKMMDVAQAKGDKDEKGSSFIKLPGGVGWKREIRRPAPKVDYEAALKLIKRKGLNHRITVEKVIKDDYLPRAISLLENNAPEFIQKVERVEDSEIETAFINGELTDAELKSVVEQGEPTYALKMIKPRG